MGNSSRLLQDWSENPLFMSPYSHTKMKFYRTKTNHHHINKKYTHILNFSPLCLMGVVMVSCSKTFLIELKLELILESLNQRGKTIFRFCEIMVQSFFQVLQRMLKQPGLKSLGLYILVFQDRHYSGA